MVKLQQKGYEIPYYMLHVAQKTNSLHTFRLNLLFVVVLHGIEILRLFIKIYCAIFLSLSLYKNEYHKKIDFKHSVNEYSI